MLVGVAEGTDFILDEYGADLLPDVFPFPGGGGGKSPAGLGAAEVLHGQAVKRWVPVAGLGLEMYKFADGWMGAARKDGTVSLWKPKKPIVIFPGATKNAKMSVRAFETSSKQLKRIAKAAERTVRTKIVYRCPRCRKDPCSCRS